MTSINTLEHPTTSTTSSVQLLGDSSSQVNALNAGWHNVVSQALNLDPTTFQFAQGTLNLSNSDSSGLFRMGDAVPPSSAVGYYDASGNSTRSAACSGMLMAILPEAGTSLRDVLGDQYANWIAYRNANSKPPMTQETLFKQFADSSVDPGQETQAIAVYMKQDSSPWTTAMDAMTNKANQQTFISSAGTSFTLPIYSATIDAAKAAVANGASATINYDSATADQSVSQTWAEGSASGFFDIFSADVAVQFQEIDQMAASSGFTVTGTINKFATLPTEPGAWYPTTEYSRAYSGNGNPGIWDAAGTSGDWNSFFAQPDGSLARRVSQFILVSDYKITVTSKASYSASDYQSVTTHSDFGIWPFYGSEDSTTTVTTNHNDDATMSVVYTLPAGAIQIWGVTVEQAPN